MRNQYRRDIKWNILGNNCGIHIIERLKWINGRPMVWATILYLVILVVYVVLDKDIIVVPKMEELVTTLGWKITNILVRVVFWVLLVDGIIVRFLWSFTRGDYHCSYFVRLFRYTGLDNKKMVKDDLAIAYFYYTHPEIYAEVKMRRENLWSRMCWIEEPSDRFCGTSLNNVYNGKEGYDAYDAYWEDCATARREIFERYGVFKDEKGKIHARADTARSKHINAIWTNLFSVWMITIHVAVAVLCVGIVRQGVEFIGDKVVTVIGEDQKSIPEDKSKNNTEMEDVLEEELDFVEEIDLRNQLIGSETLIEITAEHATIYSDVDSRRELDTATMGMQFIGTGEIQVSSDGSAWCEIYINSLRKKKAWVSIYDVKQIIE